MKTHNRLFAILLALAMVITYMPGLAYATEVQPAEEPLIEEGVGEEEDVDAPKEEAGEVSEQEEAEEISEQEEDEEVSGQEETGGETPAALEVKLEKGSAPEAEPEAAPEEDSVLLTKAGDNEEEKWLDAIFFDGVKNGEGEFEEWAHFYPLDNKNDTISLSKMNVTVKDENGDVITPENYDISIGRSWWDEKADKEMYEEIEDPGSIGLSADDMESGFTEYVLTAVAKENSGYEGEVTGTFYVMDKHSLNFLCMNAGYGNDVWAGEWRMHQYYRFMGAPEGLSVVQTSMPGTELKEGEDYTVTYYERGEDSDEWNVVFNDNHPVGGVPTEPGRYFARITGTGSYYGGNDVLVDIEDLFLVGKDSQNLWSDGEKIYDVISNLDGEVKFIIGINGNRDNWVDLADWKTILVEGTDYFYDASKKELTLNGETIYGKTGERAIDIVAYIDIDGGGKVFVWDSIGVQKAELDFNFKEDREMLPGWDDCIDGDGEVFIRNSRFPWGENHWYDVESVEIIKGVDLLDDEDTDIEEVSETVEGEVVTKHYLVRDEDRYMFRIFNLKEWQEYTGEEDEVTFRITYSCDALGIESDTYDYTVSVVPETYEVYLQNPSDQFEGLPGHEFDVNVEARHKYYDANDRYREDSNDLNYKWSYAIGSDDTWTEVPEDGLTDNDFAEFTIKNDGNGHLKFKALPSGKDEENFIVRLDLVDESGQTFYADDSMCFRCLKDYTVIWPYSLSDIEVGQKIEDQKFEVRQYSSDNSQTAQNDGYVLVPSDEVEFSWRDFEENAVRITDKEGNLVPNGRPAAGDEFSIERLADWDTNFRLEARWNEVVDEATGRTEERQIETEYRFHERDYDINFDEHDRRLYTDIYDYNEAHKDDQDFEPEDPSNRLPIGDRFGKDWDDAFELDLKVGHWEEDDTEEGKWIEDEMLDEQGNGFFSLFFPKDYTVETDDDGNVHVALTDHYLKKVEGHDDVRVEAKLYLEDDKDKENCLGRCDAWFHIEEAFVEYRDMRENEDILPDQDDTINRWNNVRVENTEYRGEEAEYEVTGVEITDGWEYLVDDVVVSEGNKHYVKKNEDEGYDPEEDEEQRGPWAWWYYRIKDASDISTAQEETGDEVPAVTFKVTYKDYDYKEGDTEKNYVFTRRIVSELSHTWIDLNGASDNGGPGAEFTLFGGAWYEFVNEEGRVEGTNEGFTFGYKITEGEEFASLTHEEGSPVATLKFKDIEIPEDGINENVQVTITAFRAGDDGKPVEVASSDRWFRLTDWHTEMFMSFDDGETWVTDTDLEIMPGTSADIKFQMRQYDSSLDEDAASDASGRYYVIENPEFWWDFDENKVKIAAVSYQDGVRTETELGKFDAVDDTDTFCFTRLSGDEIWLRLMAESDDWDEDEPFDYGMRMDWVETNLRNYSLDLVNEVLVNEHWRIVIEDGTNIANPEFTVMWNGKALPEEVYTLHIFEVTGFDEETHQRIYGDEVTGPLVSGKAYGVYATLKNEYSNIYDGIETEHYEFELYSDKSIEAFRAVFVDTETGEPVWWGPEDMPETPDFVDFFFKAHAGSAIPRLTMGKEATELDSQYYEAKYCEMEFNGTNWEPKDEEKWFEGFPTKGGVYLCEIEAKAPYTGRLEWIDLIKVVDHTLNHHDAEAATCEADGTVEYWSCSICNKNFSNAAGTTEITNIVDPKKAHNMTHHDADPVECTKEYWSCSICNKNYSNAAGTKVLSDITDTALYNAKQTALAELDKIDPNNYSGAEKTNVENALKEAREAIRNAATVDAITSAKSAATSKIGAQKTNAQKEAEADAAKKAEEAAKPVTKPEVVDLKAVKSLKLKAAKGKITVKWKKATKKELKTFQRYEIQYTLDGTFKDYPPKMVGKKKATVTLKKLLKKKKYTVRIRRYRDDGRVLHVSPWKQKKAKTK